MSALVDLKLGTLDVLKAFVLNPSLVEQTTFDDALTAAGRFMAGVFEKTCDRTFKYQEAVTEQFAANTTTLIVRRYPIAAVTALELSTGVDPDTNAQLFDPVVGGIQNFSALAGLVYLQGYQGQYFDKLRITYNGGFWYPTQSDEEEDDLPEGATPIDADLQAAWMLEVQSLWGLRDNLGKSIINSDGQSSKITLPKMSDYKLMPATEALLARFVRYSLNG